MTTKSKVFLSLLFTTALLAGGLYYLLREEPVEDTRKESIVSRMTFAGSNLTESQDGKKIWDLTAKSIEVDAKTKLVYMAGLQGAIYRTDGTKIDVTAKNAVVDPSSRNIELTDGIAMKAADGSAFNADKASYAAKDRKIFAAGSIRMIRDDYILTANELETDDKFDVIVLKGNSRIVKGGPAQ